MEITFNLNVLQTFFEESLPSVDEISTLVSIHSFEVASVNTEGEEESITIDILPNRGHDASCYYFLAKEIGHTFKDFYIFAILMRMQRLI